MKVRDKTLTCMGVWILATIWSCLCGSAFAAEVTETQVRDLLRAATKLPEDTLPAEIARHRKQIDDLLVLEVERAQWREDQLTWPVRRARMLSSDERELALTALDQYLRYALPTTATETATEISEADALSIVDRSQLSIVVQPHVSEVRREQIHAAVKRAIQQPEIARLLDRARRDFNLPRDTNDYFHIDFHQGVITWMLEPKNEIPIQPPANLPRWRRAGWERELEKRIAAQAKKDRETAHRQESQLRQFVAAALSKVSDPEFNAPLLDPDQASSIPLRIEIAQLAGAMMGGAAGVALASSSATRGAARRAVPQLRFQGIPPIETWTPESMMFGFGAGAAPVDGPPRLVIDTGTFSGAVVNQVAFSPDGKWLAAAGDVVRLWDLTTGELKYTLRGQTSWDSSGGCTDLVFTPDSRQLLVTAAGFDQSLRLYDLAFPESIREVHVGHEGHIERLAISHDGEWLVTYGIDRRLQIWDWPRREVVNTFKTTESIDHLSFPTARPNVLVITGTGKYDWMAVPGGNSVNATERGELERQLGSRTAWPDNGNWHPFAVDLSWTARHFLVGGLSRIDATDRYWCALWKDGDPQPVALHHHPYHITACALSADGQWAASADGLGNVHVWSTLDQQVRHDFATRVQPVFSVRYDDREGQLAFGRRRYLEPDWNYNHYGPLSETFDLRQRVVRTRDSESPPPAIVQQGQYALALERARLNQIVTSVDGQRRANLPFTSDSQVEPLCYSFLAGEAMGFPHGVIVGTDGGSLVCLDPDTLLSRRSFIGHRDRVWSIHQSTDHSLMVSGSGDGTMQFWNLQPPQRWGNLALLADDDGKVYHVFPNTPTSRAGIQPGHFIHSVDNQLLADLRQNLVATGAWPLKAGANVAVVWQAGQRIVERNVTLSWTGDMGRPLLSCFITGDAKDWILWTPEGYYDASPGGQRMIGWQINRGVDQAADFVPLENFRDKFYRPKVIDALLRTRNLELALTEADEQTQPVQPVALKVDAPQVLVQQPPQLTITSPAADLLTGSAEIEIVADIRSPKQLPLRGVSVVVNDKPSVVKDFEASADNHLILRRTISLVSGRNAISLVANNAVAQARSSEVVVTFRPEVAPEVKPRLFVLAVGISQYENPLFNLKYAHADAAAFAEVCTKQPPAMYESVETRVLLDHEATRWNVEKEMNWLAQAVQRDDVAILFLAGHALMDDRQNYYFATHELDPQDLRNKCVPWSWVHNLARDQRGMLLLFADTCHAGGIAGLNTIIGDPLYELTQEDVGTIVFAASGRNELSVERDAWKHGAFTKSLLDILQSAASDLDEPRDGQLSITELEHRLDRQVFGLTEGRQRPVSQKPRAMRDRNLFALPPESLPPE